MADSRAGGRKHQEPCQNCKRRKVKCDGHHPTCRACKLRALDCLYSAIPQSTVQTSPTANRTSTSSRPSRLSISSRTSSISASRLFPDNLLLSDEVTQFPESRERRLLEIRLMTHLVQNMLVSPSLTDRWLAYWRETIPPLAIRYDAVLYASCACSAGHLLQHLDNEAEFQMLQDARQNYMVLALREQRQLCDFINEDSAEAICLSAAILVQATFMLMQDPSRDVLEAAVEWVKISNGVGPMMWKIGAAVEPNVPEAFEIFRSVYQRVREQWREETAFDEPFASVWAFICAREHNADNKEVYRQTLVYISWIQRYSPGGEPSVIVERRLQTFGVQVPAEYVKFLEDRNPLALVVLAYFFGVMAQAEGHYWWLQPLPGVGGNITSRKIQAIQQSLDQSYHTILAWPLEKAKLPS